MRSSANTGLRDGFFTTRDGIRHHFREYGARSERPPLLCLHGLTRNARDFDAFAGRMALKHHVITLDFRGRGQSDHDPDPARYLPTTYAPDVVALLDHLGIAEAIIVGTSLGGIVAMVLAMINEERIAATILNDVGPVLEAKGIERIRSYVGSTSGFASWAEAAAAAKSMNRGFPVAWGEAQWEAMARRLCSEAADGTVRPDYDPAIAEPFRTATTAVVDMWPFFDALAAKPVLVIRGGESDLLSAEGLQAMVDRSPNVVAVTVPGVAHAPDLDEPEALAAIDAFLSKLDV